MPVIETSRLQLCRFMLDDAPFILALLNEPSFLQYIGDRGVRTLDDARQYLNTGPLASYAQHGYGLYLAVRREDSVPIGMCGLLRRGSLDAPDLGYAFLPAYWSQGYATEAAAATLDYGRRTLGLGRIVAITAPENYRSIKLLEKLGLHFERMWRLAPDNVVMLFSTAGPA
jgi:[ribosomal protein S5]-alanine N-acetyltransferase